MQIPVEHRVAHVAARCLAALPFPTEATSVGQAIRDEAAAINRATSALAPHIMKAIDDPKHWAHRDQARHLVQTFIDLHLHKIRTEGVNSGDDRKLLALLSVSRALRLYPDRNTRDGIGIVANHTRDLLLVRNQRCGNRVLEPIRMFARTSPLEQIDVRIDELCGEIIPGRAMEDADEGDLIAWLVMRRVALGHSARMRVGG